MPVTIELQQLTCVRDGDFWGAAEPYLWTFFIALDTPPVQDPVGPGGYTLSTAEPLVYMPMGVPNHGNLGVARMASGQTIQVPNSIGRHVFPFAFAGELPEFDNWTSYGLVTVLLEQDWSSEVGIEAGRRTMRNLLENQLRNMVLAQPDQPAGQPAFRENDVRQAVAELFATGRLPGEVLGAIRSSQSMLASVADMLHPDDLIGYDVRMWSFNQIPVCPVTINFTSNFSMAGQYQLTGAICR